MQVQVVAEIMNDLTKLYDNTYTTTQAQTLTTAPRLARLIRLGFIRRDRNGWVLVTAQGKEFYHLVSESNATLGPN